MPLIPTTCILTFCRRVGKNAGAQLLQRERFYHAARALSVRAHMCVYTTDTVLVTISTLVERRVRTHGTCRRQEESHLSAPISKVGEFERVEKKYEAGGIKVREISNFHIVCRTINQPSNNSL